jgi:aldose 1-epimerase
VEVTSQVQSQDDAARTPVPPSGEQIELRLGDQRAVVVEVGGGVRAYDVGGRPVLDPYAVDAICDGAHGAPLVPWPNRLGDGRYSFDGTDYQLALTEPGKANAIHGLMRWRSWQVAERERERVVMAAHLRPMQGYPFALDLQVAYELDGHGLRVTTRATNVGATACPYGTGQHPYLSPGAGLVDDCTFQLQAATRVDTDDDRQLPTGRVPVAGSTYDFGAPRRLGDLAIDYAFTDLVRDADGRAWMHLTGPDGGVVSLWVDGSYPYLEVFTGDTLAPARRRRGLGAEPMTCPPNAFATGEQVHRLEPGSTLSTSWGVTLA